MKNQYRNNNKLICDKCSNKDVGCKIYGDVKFMNENKVIKSGTAMLIEIVGALFCLLGLGWIYSGKAVIGAILLIVYLIIVAVEAFLIFPLITLFTLGFGAVVYVIIPIQNIIFGVISGLILKRNLDFI